MRWFAAALVLGLAAALRAQEIRIPYPSSDATLVGVSLVPHVAGGASRGGLGFLAVDAQNLDNAPHRLQVDLHSNQWQDHDVRSNRVLDLGPGERARYFLPVPAIGSNVPVEVRIDGATYWNNVNTGNREHTALLIGDDPKLQPAVLAVVMALWSTPGTGANAEVDAVSATATPADWRLYTAFDLVVVDGRSGAPPDLQEALRRFAFAGGRVVVLGPDLLPAGALRAALDRGEAVGTFRTGLGALVKAPRGFDGQDLQARIAEVCGDVPVLPLPQGLGVPQAIPGLTQAPVVLFLLVMLAFAIAVGPVNLFWLKRTRRPLLALLTVPVLGFGTTAIMIGFAIVHDGFGVRGVARSWTVLDQVAHEAVNVNARTLFSGLAPGDLPLGDDAMLLAPRALYRPDRSTRDRWHFDATTGALDGGVLPARTPTALLSVRQGTARARLAASVRPDGDLDLRTDGGVQPIGSVVVRGFDGEYWAGTAPRLQRCSAEEAKRVLAEDAATSEQWQPENWDRHQNWVIDEENIVTFDLLSRLAAGGLRPGSYVATVAAGDWIPEFGLAVAYEEARHHVLGYLAAEDLTR